MATRWGVRIDGLEQARQYLENVREGAEWWGSARALIGSDKPYAFGMEFGYFRKVHRIRRSRIARLAGGMRYLHRGAAAVRQDADRQVAEALPGGQARVARALIGLAERAEQVAQSSVRSRGGRLRASIRSVIRLRRRR